MNKAMSFILSLMVWNIIIITLCVTLLILSPFIITTMVCVAYYTNYGKTFMDALKQGWNEEGNKRRVARATSVATRTHLN
jgi:TM2 domain-containing membrane protein YozV